MKAKPFVRNGNILVIISLIGLVTHSIHYDNVGMHLVANSVKEAIGEFTILFFSLVGFVLHTIGKSLEN